VHEKDGASAKTGKVVGQSPKSGKKLAPGTKVKVILAQPQPASPHLPGL
jgi:beta-lactam-binding protein with PASTA domain